jgi:hypothetical protein
MPQLHRSQVEQLSLLVVPACIAQSNMRVGGWSPGCADLGRCTVWAVNETGSFSWSVTSSAQCGLKVLLQPVCSDSWYWPWQDYLHGAQLSEDACWVVSRSVLCWVEDQVHGEACMLPLVLKVSP